jgi:hypothetical protein
MSYMLLIMEQAERRKQRAPGQRAAELDAMLEFQRSLKDRGLHLGSESLRSLSDGIRVGSRNGRSKPVDGPFAEAKEIIGGFFHLDVATREEALAIARECPAAEYATVEVREVGPCNSE